MDDPTAFPAKQTTGVGGVLGSMGKIFGCSFHFHPRSLFSFTWELGSGWACLDQFLADRVEREETNWMKGKVLSSKSFCCSLLLSVLDTVLLTKVLANKCLRKYFGASICSKDLLESLIRTRP